MNKKTYILILVFLLCPLIIYAEFFETLNDEYLFDEERPETITDRVIAPIVGYFSDDMVVKIDLQQNNRIYDMFGNFLYFGRPWFDVHVTRFEDNRAIIYTGQGPWWLRIDDDQLKRGNIGTEITMFGLIHRFRPGTSPLMFTPMTLKKFKLYGLRWDIKTMEESVKLKTFCTTEFEENNFYEDNTVTKEDGGQEERQTGMDKMLFAGRLILNLGELHEDMPEILEGQQLGVSMVNNQLKNGFYDDYTGEMKDFWDEYSRPEKPKGYDDRPWDRYTINEGFIIIEQETLVGSDISGELEAYKYYLEYVYNYRLDHVVTEAIKSNFGKADYLIKDHMTTNKTEANAWLFALHSEDAIKISDDFKFEICAYAWHVDTGYLDTHGLDAVSPYNGPTWAMDDDDDNDHWADENPSSADGYFPFHWSGGNDEPQAGVIYQKYNRNMNHIPDYKEDFLLFWIEQYFEKTMVLEDANNNGIMDYDENDFDPDFPFDRDRQGFKGYVGMNPYNLGQFFVGATHNKILSSYDPEREIYKNSEDSYFFGFRTYKEFAEALSVKGELLFQNVSDTIPDNYVVYRRYSELHTTREGAARTVYLDYNEVYDSMAFQDNDITKLQVELGIVKYDNVILQMKFRRTHNTRNFDNIYNRFSRDIFKAGYILGFDFFEKYDWFAENLGFLSSLTLSPLFKYEKAENRYFNEDMSEKFIASDNIITDQREFYRSKNFIFTARYDFDDNMYLIGGIMFRDTVDLYSPQYSSLRRIYGFQFVLLKAGEREKKKGTSAMLWGTKWVREKFNLTDKLHKEDSVYISLITAF